MNRKILKSLFLTLSVFGVLGWAYIAMNAIFHPWTLGLPLTHFLDFPREDTFGALCFGVAFISFFIWNLIKDEK